MEKKYIVRLTEEERKTLREVIKKLKGSSQKVRRAQILLKADADGPNWTDRRIAEAFSCRTQTVESLRQRLVTEGFDVALTSEEVNMLMDTNTLVPEPSSLVLVFSLIASLGACSLRRRRRRS